MLTIYNTLTKKKELFVPIDKSMVKMYSCGPTVYNYAHIGNMRTYIFMDLLRRILKYNGYNILGVMNITDVGHLENDADTGEDKIETTARKQNKSPYEIAEYYTQVFFNDLELLNIEKPEIMPKATEHISEMINFVSALLDKGYAYQTSDGIYFDISKFKDYGKLSGINLEDQLAGARVDVNEEKRNPYDFALWKKASAEHIMQWESPWGMGYPGWHIECSAMSKKYLGNVFDIHTGGVDHIPIHHENEIAQSEALEGKKTVNYWMHGEFMQVNNGKMSKSLGNTYTLAQLSQKDFEPMDFRYFCLNTHYRKKLNFTFNALKGAHTARIRLIEHLSSYKNSDAKSPLETIEKYNKLFENAINDDLNVPLALGIVWTALKEPLSIDIYNFVLNADKILGLDLEVAVEKYESKKSGFEVPEQVYTLARQRLRAKEAKDYLLADTIRQQIIDMGYNIIDIPKGYKISKIY